MHTLMYIMDKLETAEGMVSSLKTLGIDYNAYHVLSKDVDGVRRHHLHDASPLEQSDLIHSGTRGAMIGAACGILFALGLVLIQPFSMDVGWGGFIVASLFIGFFGAWAGGMAGIGQENYKLAPFHDAIEEGKYLMLIGVRDAVKAKIVKEAMHVAHPQARFAADDESTMDPFASKPEFRVRHVH